MEEFKKLWEEVLQEIVLPKGYLNSIRETLSDSLLISKAFQYCVIMRTKEGLEDFLNYHGPNEQFFVSNLTETLNLQNETEENRKRIIIEYLKNAVINNGFISHTTNNLSAENIMKYGFRKTQTTAHTQGVLDELRQIFPEGVFRTDLNFLLDQKERTGWFYDRSPYHFKRYSDGPEWFKRLVGSTNFMRRDYEASKASVIQKMEYYNEPNHKKQQAIEVFNKYWNLYAPTTPHLLLVSIKDNELRPEREIEYVETLDVDKQLEYYTDIYFRITDRNTDKEISPDSIIDIDMYEMQRRMEEGIYKL